MSLNLTFPLPVYLSFRAFEEIHVLSINPLLWGVWFRLYQHLKLKLKLDFEVFFKSPGGGGGGDIQGGKKKRRIQVVCSVPVLPTLKKIPYQCFTEDN